MVSVKDLADSLNVTRQTIRNEMRRQMIQPTENRDSHGRPCFMIEDEAAEKISAVIRKRQEIREEDRPSELEQLRKEKAALANNQEYLAGRYAEAAEKVKEQESEIERLRLQISAKDDLLKAKEELLAAKEEQIQNEQEHAESLLRMANNLTESLKASQVLAAGYQKQIEQLTATQEKQSEEAGSDHEKQKKWWQFWK